MGLCIFRQRRHSIGARKVQHNESSKIYYYLRTGLPAVSEAPIPNNHLIEETNLGFIADYAENQVMAEMIAEAVHKKWHKDAAG